MRWRLEPLRALFTRSPSVAVSSTPTMSNVIVGPAADTNWPPKISPNCSGVNPFIVRVSPTPNPVLSATGGVMAISCGSRGFGRRPSTTFGRSTRSSQTPSTLASGEYSRDSPPG